MVAEWRGVGYNGMHVGESGKLFKTFLTFKTWDGKNGRTITPVLSACGSETVRGFCLRNGQVSRKIEFGAVFTVECAKVRVSAGMLHDET